VNGPPQKRQKTVLTVSAMPVSGDAGGAVASSTHHTIGTAVGVPKSQLCTAAVAAPLLEGVSEQQSVTQRPELPVHAPRPASVMVHASAEMEHPITVAQPPLSIADSGTATEREKFSIKK
jgi:hypothetical protein